MSFEASGPSSTSGAVRSADSQSDGNHATVVLGIDPSLRGTGWGILQCSGSKLSALAFGVIRNPSERRISLCLVAIRKELSHIIAKHRPSVVAIEGLIYAQNIRTALIMGQARGAVLLAAAEAGLEIYEYAPRRVKQGVVGRGGATKNQVGFMIRALLGLTETPEPDAADALAVAVTHAHARQTEGRPASSKEI